jgi:hypothetical protein
MDGWQAIEQCKSEGDITNERLEWEYLAEFLRKNHFVYYDQKGKQVIRLVDGEKIPGTNYEVAGIVNAPIAPHIVTVAQGITAKLVSNWPFLVPQVRAATSEDIDRDSAKNSSLLLRYYREANDEEEIYNQIIEYLKQCGNVYLKTYWNKNIGDYGAMNERGEAIRKGDITVEVNAPQKMLVPKGIALDKNLPWIGEQNAVPIEDIYDIWGVEVQEEDNLEDINSLRGRDYSGGLKTASLRGHARVYEIYFKPNKKYPLGRLVIGCNKKILYDGVWDEKLTSQYPDEWHPYTHIKWLTMGGDYWAKSALWYVIEHQIMLNRLYKILMTSKKYPNGMWVYDEEATDWKKVKQNSDNGILRVPYKTGRTPPTYQNAPINNPRIINEMLAIMKWMDDDVGNYEVSRGNNIPGVTSGKQVQMLQAANTVQAGPLTGGIARGFLDGHWKKELRLCAVHFEDIGRLIRITGENNESIAFTFTPDQITSDNIILEYGPLFYMEPQARMQELDRLFAGGFFGSPQDPVAQKRYARLRGISGGLEEVYAELEADEQMQEIENRKFEAKDWLEKDVVLMEKHPLMQPILQWRQAKQVYEGAIGAIQTGQVTPEQMKKMPPPPDPGPEPPMPKIYLLARPYEDHATHLKTLNRWRKSTKFEQMCLEDPELRIVTDFHEQSHMSYLTPPAIPGGLNMPAPPPGGNPGLIPGTIGA